jgi:uncharacterized protein YjbI with pentapeptide repeats
VLSRAAFLVVFVAVVGLANASGAAGGGEKTVTASTLAERPLLHPLVLAPGSVVRRDVHFDPRMRNGLRCRRCHFQGNVDLAGSNIAGALELPGATFGGVVDLRGAHVKGGVDLSEAHFGGPVLASKSATFDGLVDFSLAEFSSLVTFKAAAFRHGARFPLARFGGDAIFGGPGGKFDDSGTSTGGSNFARASFHGSADFDGFQFNSPVTFQGAVFKGHTDFSDVSFAQVSFGRAVFGAGATFVAATFALACPFAQGDTFDDVESDADLNFSFAQIHSPIDFESVDVKGMLSFDGATIEKATAEKKVSCNGHSQEIEIEQPRLHLLHLAAGALEMSVGFALAGVNREDQPSVLTLIESSAKTRGDLGRANDANYASHVLKSQGYPLPWHVLDFVFYRTFAGYLVRPSNPLLVLLALAAGMALYRAARTATGEEGRPATVAARTAASLPRSFVQTVSLIVPARWVAGSGGGEGAASIDRSGTFIQIETFTYRVLIACVLIGLANSNPTLRQMLDSIS